MRGIQGCTREDGDACKMIRILQANLNRSRTADALLRQLAYEHEADVLIISEQYRDLSSRSWYRDELGTAAVWVRNPNRTAVTAHGRGGGFVWVVSGGVTYISCYLTPNEPIQPFRDKVDALEDEILRMSGKIIVAGDFNARSTEWGMPNADSRGNYITEMAARRGLVVLNTGSTSTFRRPGYGESIPDVSFATEDLVSSVEGWSVLEDYTGSDHQYITFGVRERPGASRSAPQERRRWNAGRLDEARFASRFRGAQLAAVPPTGSGGREWAEAVAEETMGLLRSACDLSMPRHKPGQHRRPVYWWTAEIADLRRVCLRLRRRAQRARDREEANRLSGEHKAAKKMLRYTINRSKVTQWRKLGEEVDADPWGLGYKIVAKKLGTAPAPSRMNAETTARIVDGLFPSHPPREEPPEVEIGDIPLFTEEELGVAVASLRNRKAPGPDEIPAEALKAAYRARPELLLRMYNTCLTTGTFCQRWKMARLVLISKGKGDVTAPSSYRPLCMLDTAGKVLEKLVQPRLLSAIRDAGDLSERQYGFRRGRSTIGAIEEVVETVRKAEEGNHHSRRLVLLVTLDVKNAFNSARWADILEALEAFRVPEYLMRVIRDYLRDRSLVYETEDGQCRRPVTAGAAQGSILGPNLWNVAYDGLLRLEMPEEARLIGYADDVAVLIAARNVELAQLKLNMVMRRVSVWMASHGLALALAKTEIVILTKRRINTILPLMVGEERVETKPAAKYLGVMIDSKLTFGKQLRRAAEKAAAMVANLSRIMANTHGPSSSKRRLLMTTVQSVLLYGAEIWGGQMRLELYRRGLASVQRRAALRVACAYRTVSEAAVLVIAGVIPIGLLAMEREAIYRRKAEIGRARAAEEERARTMGKWQESWDNEPKGRWTARLLPRIEPWVSRKHGEVNYHLTQLLSGHGCFRSYLHRVGRAETPECPYCGSGRDDAEHALFHCGRWADGRAAVEEVLGRLSPDNVMGHMLEGEEKWRLVAEYVENTLRTKNREAATQVLPR